MTRQRARVGLWLAVTAFVCVVSYRALYSLVPFGIGALIAYAMAPLVERLIRLIPIRHPNHESWRRGLGVGLVYLAFFGLVTAVALSLVPIAAAQIAHFIDELPAITAAARDGTFGILEEYQKRTPPEIQERVNRIVEQMASTFGSLAGVAVQQTLATVTSTLGFAFGFLVVPFWMFYAMRDRHFVGRTIVSTAPAEVREDVRRMLTISDRMLGRYVRAQLVLGVVVGVSVGVALALLGVDLSLGLGVWAGVTELIPIIGPWIGAIPGLIIIAATNPSLLPWVALTYLVVQQLENNLLVPRIQGQALDLHPALIIVLLVVGGAVWGFIGLVTVVPGTAILRELFWYVDRRLRGQSPDEAFAQSRLHNPALDGAPERDLEAIEAAG